MAAEKTTQKSLALLASRGAIPWEVERWQYSVKVDLYNIFDIVAIYPHKPELGILAVQTTSAGHYTSRRKKIIESPYSAIWMLSGGKIELHGWDGKLCRIGHGQLRQGSEGPLVEFIEEA